jgi:flagellar basal-body rod protein FlgG
MIKGIYFAARSLNNGFQKMNSIANNLANINTTGYKREIPFSEVMESVDKSQVTQYTDFSQGGFVNTSSPLDLAISGDGFFVLETNRGPQLTRSGNFTISEEGYIVNENGDKLIGTKGPVNLNEYLFDNDQELKVMRNGEILIGNKIIDRLLIMQTTNSSTLQRDSNDDNIHVDENSYQVLQGYLEESNVNPILEMESMIQTSNDYQSSSKMVNFLDRTLEKSIEIGKV